MTKVRFISENGVINGFSVKGHSSLDCDDEFGKIVCAAVSSAVYMAANTVLEIIGDKAEVNIGEAEIFFKTDNPKAETVVVLKGFKLHIEQLAEQYGDKIKIYSEV